MSKHYRKFPTLNDSTERKKGGHFGTSVMISHIDQAMSKFEKDKAYFKVKSVTHILEHPVYLYRS